MRKKKNDQNMLIPGVNGWDLWSCSNGKIELLKETYKTLALEIESLPTNKPLHMAFPVNELTSLALLIPTSEKEHEKDLALLQVEKMGLLQKDEHGVLHQHTYISDSPDEEQALYSIDVLRAPVEGKLPKKSPKGFNVSPRCFTFEINAVTLWKEFGKWVMAISNDKGAVIHYQGFTTSNLDAAVIEDIKFTVGQLLIQNVISHRPEEYIIWTEEEGLYPEGYEVLEKVFTDTLRITPKPLPLVPPAGELLPEDTRAKRISANRKKKRNILLTLVSILILGLLGYAGYALWDLDRRATQARIEADDLIEKNQTLVEHYNKWDELGPLVETKNDPISLFLKAHKAIPNSNVRLTRAEFTNQNSDKKLGTIVNTILLQGEASDLALASKLDENLQKSKDLAPYFNWQNPSPTQTKTGWGFIYRADKK